MAFLILVAQGEDPIDAINLIVERRPIARAAYAEQAIDWWPEKSGAHDNEAIAQIRRIKRWRKDRHIPREGEPGTPWSR